MSDPKPIKGVHMWAVQMPDGELLAYSITRKKELAEKWLVEDRGERVIPVLITPLSESGEKK